MLLYFQNFINEFKDVFSALQLEVYVIIGSVTLSEYILFQVIPPGMEFHHIIPHDGDMDAEPEPDEDGKSPDPPIWTEVRQIIHALNQ